jgi:hypothetical protein
LHRLLLLRNMYSNAHAAMPPPQSRSVAPETFLLDQEAQNSLPPESIVALQQVDNCASRPVTGFTYADPPRSKVFSPVGSG